MTYGYTGKILHVNLTKSELEIEEPDEQFYRTYMGGSALRIFPANVFEFWAGWAARQK